MNHPMVFISSSYPGADLNFVGVDSEQGGYLAGIELTTVFQEKRLMGKLATNLLSE